MQKIKYLFLKIRRKILEDKILRYLIIFIIVVMIFYESIAWAMGITLLHQCSMAGNKTLCNILISFGANPNAKSRFVEWTPLHCASKKGHKEIVELLLRNGADVNFKERDEGWTPLHIATIYGHYDTVIILLKYNADINITDNKGHVPLYYSKIYGYKEITTLFELSDTINNK